MIRTRKKRKKEGGKNDSVPVLFTRYVSLNVMGMIGLSCYILADTYFVSKALGASGLASLNLAISVYSIISATGLMFGIGGATRFAILKTQGEDKEPRFYLACGDGAYNRLNICRTGAVFFRSGCNEAGSGQRNVRDDRYVSEGDFVLCPLFYPQQCGFGIRAQ